MKATIIPIFPTPIYRETYDNNFLKKFIKLFDQEELSSDKGDWEYGKRSINSYILNKPEYQDLSNQILNSVKEYCNIVLSYQYKKYKFSQSWVSVKKPNMHHIQHTHPWSLVSGVLFYGEGDTNTKPLVFAKRPEIINETLVHIGPDYQDKHHEYPIFSGTEYSLSFIPNTLILFPSNLIHYVPKNTSNQDRKSLAFNVVPRDGFGHEENLTQLKF